MNSLVLLVVTGAFVNSQASEIQLDVYYESQCPFCYLFFSSQLRPVSSKLHKYINVNLVPYGNAKTFRNGNQVRIQCQHKEAECYLNQIHACALNRLTGDNMRKVEFASCLLAYYTTPTTAGKLCSAEFGLEWADVQACARGNEGITLADRYGNETNALSPRIKGVPTVAINKMRGNDNFQSELTKNLQKVLCKFLAKEGATPEECND